MLWKFVKMEPIMVVLLISLGISGCQSGPNEDASSNMVRLDSRESGKDEKYFAKLADLLPRYYEIMGIDYGEAEPTWKTALITFRELKVSLQVHSLIEGMVGLVEKILQKRMVSHSASPSNTLFMPINLLVGLIRAFATSGGILENCVGRERACQFERQVFMRVVADNRMCIETQKRTQPSTDYYRFYRGLVDYLQTDLGIQEKQARVAAMEFLDTYILPIYLATASSALTTYRWTTNPDRYYPPDLVEIEEFVAAGPPSDSDPQASTRMNLFRRFYRYAKSFWDNKVVIDPLHPSTTRDVFSTVKSIATDIRHLR